MQDRVCEMRGGAHRRRSGQLRDQQLTVASCRRLEGGGSDQTKVRDVFADAEAEKGKIEAVAFDAPSKSMTYEEQLRAVAVTTEGSN